MYIVVCVKQVPALSEVKIDPKTNTLLRQGFPGRLNPFDEHAVEEALRIKEKHGGHITALSMGPPQAEEVLARCLAMGVDKGILLTDTSLIGSDTLATSYVLSRVIEGLGFDIILCGQETTDSSTGQVGPEIAEHLNIPQITLVRKIEKITKGGIIVQRQIDEGYQVIHSKLPVLLAVTQQINEPRELLPKKASSIIKKIGLADFKCDPTRIGIEGSPTQVVTVSQSKRTTDVFFVPSYLPARQRIKLILSGGMQEKENNLLLWGVDEESAERAVRFVLESTSSDGTS